MSQKYCYCQVGEGLKRTFRIKLHPFAFFLFPVSFPLAFICFHHVAVNHFDGNSGAVVFAQLIKMFVGGYSVFFKIGLAISKIKQFCFKHWSTPFRGGTYALRGRAFAYRPRRAWRCLQVFICVSFSVSL